ncbi:magnesium chelatase subunit ChlI family protein [Bradyrhizobium diazoefficiens]
MPLRQRVRARLCLQARPHRSLHRRLPGAHLGALDGPHRFAHRGPGGDRGRPDPAAAGAAEVAARVAAARDIQLARYADIGLPNVRTNAEAPASVLEDIAKPDAQGAKLLRDAAETMRLSARGYHRVLRVARTLADLDNADKIGRLHLAEALSYRALAEDVRQMA